ncbi:MAG: hypothetical protein IKX53_04620 [Bacteroidales bacterium]|nr:hypothetical protein [Bacteroidales bacterium]MBR5018903.1 hypothetical protein [Bacteroidales bacterium]
MISFRYLTLLAAAFLLLLPVPDSSAQPGRRAETPSPASSVEYYLPVQGTQYRPDILPPQAFLGFELDDRLADWGDITRYVDYLAEKSDRVSVKRFGYTFERRQFLQVCITSPRNQRRLESIREEHLKVTDAAVSGKLDLKKIPLVVDLRATIHGNEISGAQALLAVLFHYAAAEGKDVEKLLENTILLVVPAQNPDGMSRFATWVNSNASRHHFLDNQAREYHEAMPSSRANHYWMDTNRDWLTAQYPEGRNLVTMYEYWMPNVLLDLHEMGSARNGLYYFSPGDPNRTYPYIPQENQDLTRTISETTAHSLDSIGVPYFTGRGYDDFFIGKGACYGDIQGSVCILHELSSPRGHLRDFGETGVHSFGETVRWHGLAAVGVLNAAMANAAALKDYQRRFYADAAAAAAADPAAGYVFDTRGNRGIAFKFLENLLLHQIEVYPMAGEEGRYYVPFRQKHYYKVKGIFEDITEFQDDKFYDISTWSPARAFNLEYGTVQTAPAVGAQITEAVLHPGAVVGGQAADMYSFLPDEFYAPWLIAALQEKGIRVEVTADGTLVIPVAGQPLARHAVYELVSELAAECGVDVTAGRKGKKQTVIGTVRQPRTALITGVGASSQQGSLWHLLDEHYGMNHSLVDFSTFAGAGFDIDRYDALVFAGAIPLEKAGTAAWQKLAGWVEAGGTLLLLGEAHKVSGTIDNDSITAETGKGVSGLVLHAEMVPDSPLFWGYRQPGIDIFKSNATVWTVADDARVLMRYSAEPYRSGYVTAENLARFAGAPVVALKHVGKGCILYMQEDFAYRAYWLGTNHILANALFFGNLL